MHAILETILKFKKQLILIGFTLFIGVGIFFTYTFLKPDPPLEERFVIDERAVQTDLTSNEKQTTNSVENSSSVTEPNSTINSTANTASTDNITNTDSGSSSKSENTNTSVVINSPPDKYELTQANHTYQTFNNCGPATLSMILSYYGVNVNQNELGNVMRPYQNPQGDNDDKTIFPSEFVTWAEKYGSDKNLKVINRPNGSIELLKLFISNDIPVVVKMWLNTKEDIGHFVIARGYDDTKKIMIKDDSYYGPNKKSSYYEFMSMWQSFNYSYIIVYEPEQEKIIQAILGKEMDEHTAWENAISKALKEHEIDPDNIYPLYNLSVGYYHTGDYEKSVQYFEQVENRLPRRMMWYQIEPIKAYQALGEYNRVFELINKILNDNNRAFSELYYIRGEIYLERGDKDKAKQEFENALKYNQNFAPAKEMLKTL